MIALTQGLGESRLQDIHGLHGMAPLGIVTATIYYFLGGNSDKPAPLDQINEAFVKACPTADYVLNVVLDIWPSGHPSNPERNCRVTGDAYKVV